MLPNIRMLVDPKMKLTHKMMQRFTEGDNIKELMILHTSYNLEKEIKKGVDIYSGMLLGKSKDKNKGHLYSPVRGKVTEVGHRFLTVEVVEAQSDDPQKDIYSEDEILAKLSAESSEALDFLKNMGVHISALAKQCNTLIINALNPEPGLMWAEPMLGIHLETVLKGLEIQKAIAKPQKIFLVVPKDTRINPIDGVTIYPVTPVYPHSMDVMLKHDIAKKENISDVGIVSTHTLWGLGRVLETGTPLTETVVTLGTPSHSGNYIIKEGTRIIDLLDFAHFTLEDEDTIVVGGPLRGNGVSFPQRGIPREVNGVFIVPAGSVPKLEGHSPCCNCGACDKICPVNLSPSTISRYAEFTLYDKCKEWDAEHCIECGLCGYVCMTRRPVLQYIRLAKQKLSLEEMKLTTASQDEA